MKAVLEAMRANEAQIQHQRAEEQRARAAYQRMETTIFSRSAPARSARTPYEVPAWWNDSTISQLERAMHTNAMIMERNERDAKTARLPIMPPARTSAPIERSTGGQAINALAGGRALPSSSHVTIQRAARWSHKCETPGCPYNAAWILDGIHACNQHQPAVLARLERSR